MVAIRRTPPWVIRLLAACTRDEQSAISHYRATTGKAHAAYRRGELAHAEITKITADALERLAHAAGGSPPLDRYLDRQRQHLEAFAAGGTAA